MGNTALILAVACGHLELAALLLEAGAPIDIHETAATGQIELARLLIERGADPNARTDDGRTALALARNTRDEALVDLLVQQGARD